ncbi:MAG: mechanosensitive ion channel family protein [Gammaproteobacteria bacterium]
MTAQPDSLVIAAQAWTLVRFAIIVGATVVGWLILAEILHQIVRLLHFDFAKKLLRSCRLPLILLLAAAAGLAALRALPALHTATGNALYHGCLVGLIAGCAWLLKNLVGLGGDVIMARHPTDAVDNYRARSLRTQISVIERIATVLIIFLAIAAALMTFHSVRVLGVSLLASAGFAGLAVGLAARPVLENLLAGLQISLTRPINLDDVVVIDGYWGRIEEITTTYVVVAIWDERRLILPFSRIMTTPFENWTRRQSELLETVYLYTDYGVPVDELRAELDRICHASQNWDGRVCLIQVTNATEHTLQLRVLVSVADSGKGWNLCCEVREKLIAYLRIHHPESLPRTRLEWEGEKTTDPAQGTRPLAP